MGRPWDGRSLASSLVTISVVLRLAKPALDEGRLAGEAELVTTGVRATVRNADELIQFVNRFAREGHGGSPDVRAGTDRRGSE